MSLQTAFVADCGMILVKGLLELRIREKLCLGTNMVLGLQLPKEFPAQCVEDYGNLKVLMQH